jgi:hypothetical protein
VYRNFAAQVRAFLSNSEHSAPVAHVPGMAEALRGMAFIETAVIASSSEQKWHEIPDLS